MKYKFFGQPNMLIKERKKKFFNGETLYKPVFRFDKNGEYITDDERLINKLKSRFTYTEMENNAPSDKPIAKQAETTTYKCKHCDYTTTNKGELLAHYREHKKEG